VKADDKSSNRGCAHANTAWNITNRISARMAEPATGCSTKRFDSHRQVSGLIGRLMFAADDAVGLALGGAAIQRS